MSRRDRIVAQMRRDRISITTHKGLTIEGVLLEADEKSLLLTDAAEVGAGGEKTPADGQVVIPRCDVAYIQKT